MKLHHILLAVLLAVSSLPAQQAPLHANEQVTVTAYGTPLAADQSATSTIILTPEQLQQSPALTFGDTLRNLPAVEFFRRTGTLIANPTSQGLSLRGLGSTSSSRTLVLSDHIPLNDAFGSWVHWEEFPILTVRSVEVVRGGASDLYGSSAVGGVVNILRTEPTQTSFSLLASGGSQNTANISALGTWTHKQWSAAAAGGILRTDGYIVVAPSQRGPIDTAYNAHIANGAIFLQRTLFSQKLFVRANAYNDNRANGTPDQTNADRIVRYTLGDDISLPHTQHITARLYGSDNHYRQSFSTVNMARTSENPNRLLRTPAQELGAIAQYSAIAHRHLTLFAGADIHDVRGTDLELPIPTGAHSPTSAPASAIPASSPKLSSIAIAGRSPPAAASTTSATSTPTGPSRFPTAPRPSPTRVSASSTGQPATSRSPAPPSAPSARPLCMNSSAPARSGRSRQKQMQTFSPNAPPAGRPACSSPRPRITSPRTSATSGRS